MEEEAQNSSPISDSVELEAVHDCPPEPSAVTHHPECRDESNKVEGPDDQKAEGSERECCKKNSHQDLKNQLRDVQDEIFKSLNQNLELKKRFLLVKRAVRREMGVDVGCLEELVRSREQEGWCGSKDVAEALRKKLLCLRGLLKEKRIEAKNQGTSLSPALPELPEDEKMQGLLSMEREYMIQNVRREEQKWVEDRDRLAKKLKFFVEKNKALEEEASTLLCDLSAEPESPEVVSVARFLDAQRKMDSSLERKFKLKNALLAADASVRANEAEVERLKAEVGRQTALLAESEMALRALTEGGGEDHEALVAELKIERHATSRMFRESLQELCAIYRPMLEGVEKEAPRSRRVESDCDHLLESPLVAEVKRRRDSGGKGDAGPPKLIQLPSSVELPPEEQQGSSAQGKEETGEQGAAIGDHPQQQMCTVVDEHHLSECLEEELLELSRSVAGRLRGLRRRRWRLHDAFDRLKREAAQLVDARGRLAKESAEARALLKQLARHAADCGGARAEAFRFGDASEVEDSQALLRVLREENECLRRLVRAACDSLDEDVDHFLQVSAIRVFFEA